METNYALKRKKTFWFKRLWVLLVAFLGFSFIASAQQGTLYYQKANTTTKVVLTQADTITICEEDPAAIGVFDGNTGSTYRLKRDGSTVGVTVYTAGAGGYQSFGTFATPGNYVISQDGFGDIPYPLELINFFVLPDTSRIAHTGNPADPYFPEHYICEFYTNGVYTVDSAAISASLIANGCGGIAPQGITWITTGWLDDCQTHPLSITGQGTSTISIYWFEVVRGKVRAQIETTEGCIFFTQPKYVYIFQEPDIDIEFIDPESGDTLPDTVHYCGSDQFSTFNMALSESELYSVCVPTGQGFPLPIDTIDGYYYTLYEFGSPVDQQIPAFDGEQLEFELGNPALDTVAYTMLIQPIHHDGGLALQPLPYCINAVRRSIVIIRDFQPIADAGPDQIVCDDACTTINGETGVPLVSQSENFEYFWTYSGPGMLTFDNDHDSTTLVCREECDQTSPYGLYELWFNVINGECEDSDMSELFFLEKPTAMVGEDQRYCEDTCFTIEAMPYSFCGVDGVNFNENSHWVFIDGPQAITFGDPSDPTQFICPVQDPCEDFYGVYTFAWVEVNSYEGVDCTDTAYMTVTIFEDPLDVDAGEDAEICEMSAYTLMGTGHTYCQDNGLEVSYLWAQDQDNPCTVTFGDDTMLETGVEFGSPCCYGVYTFYLTETNGECSETDEVVITRFEQPEVLAEEDFSLCGDADGMSTDIIATPHTYCADTYTEVSYLWTADQDNPCVVEFADDAAATTTVMFTDQCACPWGVYTFYFTEYNGVCEDTDELVVTRYEPPTAVSAGEDADICEDECYSLAATPSVYCQDEASLDVEYEWTADGSNPGPVSFTAPDMPATDVCFDDAACPYGPYVFYFTETNGDCFTTVSVTVNRYEQPVADAGPDDCVCVEYAMSWLYTYQMQANAYDFCYDGENCSRWRKTEGPGLVEFDDITAPDANAVFNTYGCYTFEWIECNPACADTDAVMICVLEDPIAQTEIAADTAECDDLCYDLSNFFVQKYDYQPAPNVSWDNAHWVQISGPGTATFTDATDPDTDVCVDVYGEYELAWVEVNEPAYGDCICTDTAFVTLFFFEKPIADAGEGGEVCGTCFTVEANPYVYQTGAVAEDQNNYWELINMSDCLTVEIADDQEAVTEICISDCEECYTTFYLVWHEENGNCFETDTIEVTFNKLPPETPLWVSGNDQNDCWGYFGLNGARDVVDGCMYPGDTLETCAFTCFDFTVPGDQIFRDIGDICDPFYYDDCGTLLYWLVPGWTYEWSVVGPAGTTFEAYPGYYDFANEEWVMPWLDVCWGECCELGIIYLTITTPECEVTYEYYFEINHTPDATIAGDEIAEVSSYFTYEVPYYTCALYNWQLEHCGEIVSGQGTNEVVVHWTDYNENGGIGQLEVVVLDTCTGCCAEGMLYVEVLPQGSLGDGTLDGHVYYDNTNMTPLNGVHLMLYNEGVMIAETMTFNDIEGGNGPGYYMFEGINETTEFDVMVEYGAPWYGANATDALAIMQHFNGIFNITWDALNLEAGDVNASGGAINGTDALWVMQRGVGLTNMFPAGDWAFGTSTTVDLTATAGNLDIHALNYGDVNRSNNPSGMLNTSEITLVKDGTINVVEGEEFSLPIRVAEAVELGAMSLDITFDSELIEVKEVASFEGMISNVEDNRIRIAWSSLNAMNLVDDDAVITVTAVALDEISTEDALFNIELGTEFADARAGVIEDMKLKTFGVTTEVAPAEYALGYNRPNPFNNITEITYTLPESGKVRLSVMNVYGSEIEVLSQGTLTAGTYTVQFSADGLRAGVYLYRLVVDGVSEDFVETRRMVISQ